MAGNYARRWSEVVTLLSFREYIGNIVALVTPRVHIYRREEDAKSRMQHNASARNVMRDAGARCESELAGIVQAFGISLLPTDENRWHAVLEHEIRVRVANIF